MALSATLTLTDNFGVDVTIPDLYVRVDRINGGKQGLSAEVGLYKDNGSKQIGTSTYTFEPSVVDGSTNFIAQAYEYLKTLPEFADSVDC